MTEKKDNRVLRQAADYVLIILGSIIFAVAVNVFLKPAHVAPGGFTGIAQLINYAWGLPIGMLVLIMNVPLYIIAIRKMGLIFTVKTLVSTVTMSLAIDLFDFLPAITDDRLLCAIYGGVVSGVGFSMIFYGGGTSGGSDLLAKLLMKKMNLPIGKMILIIDGIVAFASIFVYGDVNAALFAVIQLFVDTKIIDTILTGFDLSKATYIITKKPDEVADKIMHELHRGTTKLNATGMYTGTEYGMLLVVVKTRETPQLKEIIRREDPDSFAIMLTANEVFGMGFKRYDSR